MEISRFGPEDVERLTPYVAVRNAVRAADSPWLRPLTLAEEQGELRHGWDGEPDLPFLGTVDGVPVAAGSLSASDYDNHHLAWLHVRVLPDQRRRGLGSELLAHLEHEARQRGRTVVGLDGWEGLATTGFAGRHGYVQKSVGVQRRQLLADVDWAEVERLHASALEAASAYELLRRVGPTPEDELEAVALMTAAINDAPIDNLDIEDEVISPERVRAYETAAAERGLVMHRVLARHRETGELAGHTVVTLERDRPDHGDQNDTSVVAGHRGHRLGLLLKTDMNLWLREAQPRLVEIDTWNAESNDQMIAVNDAIGYRVLGRELQFQKRL
jgi:GNAT superfamily N-acetyltransferase